MPGWLQFVVFCLGWATLSFLVGWGLGTAIHRWQNPNG